MSNSAMQQRDILMMVLVGRGVSKVSLPLLLLKSQYDRKNSPTTTPQVSILEENREWKDQAKYNQQRIMDRKKQLSVTDGDA